MCNLPISNGTKSLSRYLATDIPTLSKNDGNSLHCSLCWIGFGIPVVLSGLIGFLVVFLRWKAIKCTMKVQDEEMTEISLK